MVIWWHTGAVSTYCCNSCMLLHDVARKCHWLYFCFIWFFYVYKCDNVCITQISNSLKLNKNSKVTDQNGRMTVENEKNKFFMYYHTYKMVSYTLISNKQWYILITYYVIHMQNIACMKWKHVMQIVCSVAGAGGVYYQQQK